MKITKEVFSEWLLNFALFYAVLYSLFFIPYILFVNRVFDSLWIKIYLVVLGLFALFWIFEKYGDGISLSAVFDMLLRNFIDFRKSKDKEEAETTKLKEEEDGDKSKQES